MAVDIGKKYAILFSIYLNIGLDLIISSLAQKKII
jgi:hypothetical protein